MDFELSPIEALLSGSSTVDGAHDRAGQGPLRITAFLCHANTYQPTPLMLHQISKKRALSRRGTFFSTMNLILKSLSIIWCS